MCWIVIRGIEQIRIFSNSSEANLVHLKYRFVLQPTTCMDVFIACLVFKIKLKINVFFNCTNFITAGG